MFSSFRAKIILIAFEIENKIAEFMDNNSDPDTEKLSDDYKS